MAVGSLIALLAALAIAAAISLQPWATSSVEPQLGAAPGPGIALDDAVAVAPGRQVAVSSARPAGPGEARFATDAVAGGGRSSETVPGVAAARAVASPAKRAPELSPAPTPPEPAPIPQPEPAPAATPVSAPSPAPQPPAGPPARPGHGGEPSRPGSAGGLGPTGGVVSGPVEVHDGDEYAFAFSFSVQPDAYRGPAEDNSILRFWDEVSESSSFGLQLWDDGSGSRRGLWASGAAMGGERFLAPLAEGVLHEVVLAFEASSEGDGLYLLLLDGEPIDVRAWVSLIEPESGYGLLESGLFRDGERVDDVPEISFGPARLGETLESVIP